MFSMVNLLRLLRFSAARNFSRSPGSVFVYFEYFVVYLHLLKICVHLCPSVAKFPVSARRFRFQVSGLRFPRLALSVQCQGRLNGFNRQK